MQVATRLGARRRATLDEIRPTILTALPRSRFLCRKSDAIAARSLFDPGWRFLISRFDKAKISQGKWNNEETVNASSRSLSYWKGNPTWDYVGYEICQVSLIFIENISRVHFEWIRYFVCFSFIQISIKILMNPKLNYRSIEDYETL